MRSRTITVFAVALAIALLVAGLGPTLAQTSNKNDVTEIPVDAEPARYVRNIDGDTIVVELEDEDGHLEQSTVRLIGIDTPKTNYSYGNEPECYGREATNKTDSLLVASVGKTVWLESDVRDEDPYGRLLRYVWYESKIDDKVYLLNEVLVREGYAIAKTYRPNVARQDELDEAQAKAITKARGMWLTCDASVSMDPSLEDGRPDSEPIDRTRTPVEDDPEAVCSFFNSQNEAQEWLDLLPELTDELDPDGNGIACDRYFG